MCASQRHDDGREDEEAAGGVEEGAGRRDSLHEALADQSESAEEQDGQFRQLEH